MVKVNELKGLMVAKGYTQAEVAERIGIHPSTLNRKLKRGVLGSDDIYRLIDVLSIKNPSAIFFAKEVTDEVTK